MTDTLSLRGPVRSARSTSSWTASAGPRVLSSRGDHLVGQDTHKPSEAQQDAVPRLEQHQAERVDHRPTGAAQGG